MAVFVYFSILSPETTQTWSLLWVAATWNYWSVTWNTSFGPLLFLKTQNKQTNFHHDLLILFELGDFQKSVVEFHGTGCNMSAFIEFFLTTSHFSRINNTISIQSDSTAGFGPLLGCQLNIVTVVFCTSFPTFWLDLCLQ